MSQSVNRFLGGSPLGVIFRLVVISLLVGIVLAGLGITPIALIEGVVRFFERIWSLGFDALGQVWGYILAGASIVIPVWLIFRLIEAAKRR